MCVGCILPTAAGRHGSRHDPGDRLTDSLGRRLDLGIADMSVAKRHARMSVSQQTRHRRQRNPLHDGVSRDGVSQIVQANVRDARFAPHRVPECEAIAPGIAGVGERRKHPGAVCLLHQAPDDSPGLRIQVDPSRSRLAIAQIETVAIDLPPAQPHDFTLATTGQQ